MITLEEYKKAKKLIDDYENQQLNIGSVSYYYLTDGDMVKVGDEYYDTDKGGVWVTIPAPMREYEHDTMTCYKTRRKADCS